MGHLQGRTALVTGAGRGIGAALAIALDTKGANVGVAFRSYNDLGIENAVTFRPVSEPSMG